MLAGILAGPMAAIQAAEPTRVFIFAGQSNMEGADSKVEDIKFFPPFRGLEEPQTEVKFRYSIGRQNKTQSEGWEALKPVRNLVGPELSFARHLRQQIEAPIAIIKCAAGGTHLGGDWNPTSPQGFKMYPLMMEMVQAGLKDLEDAGIEYQLEGVVWHQGENDMFNEGYMAHYGENLAQLLAKWRTDLDAPNLRFYIGELCTKTIWGMDLRPRMYAISQGQKAVTEADPLADYVPSSHIGVEIGNPVGLHYHYGTLGQLEQGINYANAYLRNIGMKAEPHPSISPWPYPKNSVVRLFIMAGHRNMEGERAFKQELLPGHPELAVPNSSIAYKYSIGGDFKQSNGWEPLRPAGYYDTFGPEVSFAFDLQEGSDARIAIAKFCHGGSQMNDWTPEGSPARSRHIYPRFIEFVRESISELEERGHSIELAGIFYHVGENEMSMPPYRKQSADWLRATIEQSRIDLNRPQLPWFVSQQQPTKHPRVDQIDVIANLKQLATEVPGITHIIDLDIPPQRKQLVFDTEGVIQLGKRLANVYLNRNKPPRD